MVKQASLVLRVYNHFRSSYTAKVFFLPGNLAFTYLEVNGHASRLNVYLLGTQNRNSRPIKPQVLSTWFIVTVQLSKQRTGYFLIFTMTAVLN